MGGKKVEEGANARDGGGVMTEEGVKAGREEGEPLFNYT